MHDNKSQYIEKTIMSEIFTKDSKSKSIVKISQWHKTNGVLSRLLTHSHEVGKCALFVAGLKKVENVNIVKATCLFMAKSREACSTFLVNSPPPRAASVGGRLVAADAGSQVLSLAGLEVFQW